MPAIHRHCLAALAAAALFTAPAAHAQLMNNLKGALGGGSQSSDSSSGSMMGGLGNLGSLGGAAMPSLGSVGTGNLTGLLSYCVKNNYLGGGDASSVQSKLLGKLGGSQQAQSDTGYQQGLSGILGGDSGQKVDLNSSSLKGKVTDKVCDEVLKYGKSLL